MMKKNYFCGTVIHGLNNGEKFGFRTANIQIEKGETPQAGVYAVKVFINRQNFLGMLYVGSRPSLNLTQLTVEVHLFDMEADLYHQQIAVEIIQKIREEIKFETIDALIAQLKRDKVQISEVLKRGSFSSSI
jgi:riboflavin kinase/FMN adenylyltransferase